MDETPGPINLEELLKAWKLKPTIEEWVRLRKTFPGLTGDVATTGGIEFIFSQEEQLTALGTLEPIAFKYAHPES
jgi:hypothetical protein